MSDLSERNGFFGREYIIALRQHYPQFKDGEHRSTADRSLHIGIVNKWMQDFEEVGVDAPDRLQPIKVRPWNSARSSWAVSGRGKSLRHAGVYSSYKGLINLKPAIDLVLYSNLIWELQPQTILEFGSLQGGSALWFSDQLDALCGHGEVHSFEMCIKCISSRASHARLHFHEADLREVGTLDLAFIKELPHPWLVVDDAHENLENVVPLISAFMMPGDYYVIEDVLLWHPERVGDGSSVFNAAMVSNVANMCESLGFLVDTKYCDAFGLNVTCAPNGWWVKR